jgi:integrase
MPKLTKRRVDAIVAGPRPREVWDDELKGFGVRVHPTGRKVFIVMTRVQGRQVRVTIGQHGAFTVAGARARAVEIIARARAGEDPSPRRNGAREDVTVRALCRRFLDDYVSVHCKPRTFDDYSHSVNSFIIPKLGAFRVNDVRRDHVAALHQDMRATPYQANRTLAVLSKMFNLAELWEIRPDGSNPCRHVKRYRERRRERFLSDAEYVRLGEALRDAERSEMPSAVTAIRLLMLTGCRLSEVLTLRWDYVDMDAGQLHLPDSKSGAKIVHLGEPALAVLRGIERAEGNPWVIVGRRRGRHLTDLQNAWRRIRAQAGLDDVRIHDLRHSFASGGLLVGEGLPMIGKLLGHTQVQTTARYAHLAADPVKAAANRISERIAEVTG